VPPDQRKPSPFSYRADHPHASDMDSEEILRSDDGFDITQSLVWSLALEDNIRRREVPRLSSYFNAIISESTHLKQGSNVQRSNEALQCREGTKNMKQ
jgi:hypothetical protein